MRPRGRAPVGPQGSEGVRVPDDLRGAGGRGGLGGGGGDGGAAGRVDRHVDLAGRAADEQVGRSGGGEGEVRGRGRREEVGVF